MKKYLLFLLTIFLPFVAISQTATLRGVVKDDAGQAIPNTSVSIQGTTIKSVTDSAGAYELINVPFGNQVVIVGETENILSKENVDVKDPNVIVNIISNSNSAENMSAGSTEIPMISLGDDEIKESSSGSVSSLLSGSRDVFASAVSFAWSPARFRVRGYDSENFPTLMNGAILTDISNGRSEYNAWSGLNDVVRTRENSHGLSSTNFSFGAIGGISSIDSRASQQRKQLQVSYALSNRTYDNRLVITYGSGVNSKGWSYSLSYTRRWADESYVPGTFYDGNSFFGSLEKKINSKNSLALTVFAAKTKNGRAGTAVQEMFDLAGTNYYNPFWGYQNGKKRNASVADNFQPVVILTHDWNINEKSTLETAISYQNGKNKISGIDWYKAEDPRPDYYRYLPSFDPAYGDNPNANATDSTTLANYLSQNEDARQINWDKLYEANQIHDTAKYVIASRVIEAQRYGFNTIYNNEISNNIAISGGLSFQLQDIEYYRQLDDLLGGKYFVNLNQFSDITTLSDPNVIQNDLNNPNAYVKEGDKYSFDYIAHINTTSLWAQSVFKYDRFDFFIGAQLSMTSFYRTGKVKNGVFADESYGDSPNYSFTDPAFKGGFTYKLNGRNYFNVNGAYMKRAPLFENTFVSPKTRSLTVPDIKDETISSVEGSYNYRAPKLRARVTGYFTQFSDMTDTRSFYHDDLKTFVNYTLTGIAKSHAGIELAIDATLGNGFSASAAASIGNYIYTDRPSATATQDNKDTLLLVGQEVYAKNLHVAGGPQTAYTVGLKYNSKNYWYLNVNFNYFDDIYTDYNPVRRTNQALEYVDAGTPEWVSILGQEKQDPEFTMDVSGGWSWKLNDKFKSLKGNSFLLLNLGISNILNNKELTNTAYEQLRYDFVTQDVTTFPAKYSYAYGATYFASITLRFN